MSRWGQVKDESKTDEEEIDEEQNTDKTQQKNKTTQEKNQDDKSIASDALNTSEQPTDATTQPSDEIQEKIEKNKEDFENKILDLFRGNTYYESDLVSSVMNYDSITVVDLRYFGGSVQELLDENGQTDVLLLYNWTFVNDDNHFYKLGRVDG